MKVKPKSTITSQKLRASHPIVLVEFEDDEKFAPLLKILQIALEKPQENYCFVTCHLSRNRYQVETE